MKPESIGRVLGIGIRVAGRIAGQRAAAASQTTAQGEPNPVTGAQARDAGHSTRGVARGLGGFLRPFQRVGSKIWLEAIGAFYLLFALAFTRFAVQHHPAGIQGPYDRNFLLAAGIVLVFVYLGATSFWRASRK